MVINAIFSPRSKKLGTYIHLTYPMELQFELRMLEDDQPVTLEKLRDGKILVLGTLAVY